MEHTPWVWGTSSEAEHYFIYEDTPEATLAVALAPDQATATLIVRDHNAHAALVEVMEAAKEVESDHEIRATVLMSSVSQYKLRRLQAALAAVEERQP